MMDSERKQHYDGADYDKVVNMLSPRFPREMRGRIVNFKRPRRAGLWTVGGIAAMLALVLAFAVKTSVTASVNPVSASEIVACALEAGAKAESCKVEFSWRGVLTSEDEIYTPNLDAPLVRGTLYIVCRDGKAMNRIDWHDADENSFIYDGTDYIRLKGGAEVARHPSGFNPELKNLLDIGSVPYSAGEITEDGDMIIVEHRKNDGVIFRGGFSRSDRRLTKASVVMNTDDGNCVTLMETSSVIFGADIPLSLFLR